MVKFSQEPSIPVMVKLRLPGTVVKHNLPFVTVFGFESESRYDSRVTQSSLGRCWPFCPGVKVKRTIPRPNQYIISEAVEGVLKAVKRKQVRVSPEANWNEEFKRIVTLVKIR